MVGGISIALGLALMITGTLSMWAWLTGNSRWLSADFYDRPGASKSDRLLLYTTFLATVLAPLLCGGLLIVYGLHRLR